ncbi:EscU/YscU/HrcU family type III secretion system export apparatus switch protein [Gallaecimonas pentaromativorans]|uniref:Flagellar biosynthesis protein n=1 Tax=Gallaecimonas pentaromativorans TaxID=584787 RepID=A0A3N1P732_9GAMM|nr:EscU/YscU/HrcU family type III secretion system export apparatus switch protein [Gallaecimonas pentaromativorans]MED5526661.1 EscU/YscU/HrcU family type III secretion system export apparatus switch protein [Pseudomonadota bacterium]ROQ22560.1 flagellar biosynthesis protein [Gallaecimonas pentaromativorans]
MSDPKETKAIGLSYDGSQPPKLDFKLTGEEAKAVIEMAREKGLLLHEDAALTESLMRLEQGQGIPPELYLIVAELIAYAWLLMGKEPDYWRTPDGGVRARG